MASSLCALCASARHILFVAASVCCFAAPPAQAQAHDDSLIQPKERPKTVEAAEKETERAKRVIDLQNKIGEAIGNRDYAEAERLLRQNLSLEPRNFVVYYNLACMRALQHDADGAGELLKKAIESGFVDIYRMRSDPDLRAVRKTDLFKTISDGWPKILQAHLEANLKQAGRIFDGKNGKYETVRDETLRIAIMSAMDPVSTDQAHKDIARLRDWGIANVFPELGDEAKAQDDAWTVVVLPTQRDFRKWVVATFGLGAIEGLSGVGGEYDHDQKRLVAMDLGATFRHEFFHVLHWRSMTRLGQDHPIWIMEGLCSLVEDYELGDPAKAETLRPIPSWRSNIVKRLASNGKLQSIKALAATRRDRFTGTNPLSNYAQARTVFLYLFQQGKLKEWYAHYTTHFDDDPSGVQSIEAVLSKPIAQVDRDYRAWLKALPEVAEQNKPGEVGIGADVEGGDGDGPVIVDIPRDTRNPARRAGLRIGDVITAVDGQPTRDLNELVRVLGTHKAGEEVEVAYRRGKAHSTARVTLQPR